MSFAFVFDISKWQYSESVNPQPGHELKPTGKRFRTLTSRTGRVTCTLCFLYIDIDHHALPMSIEIIMATLQGKQYAVGDDHIETLSIITDIIQTWISHRGYFIVKNEGECKDGEGTQRIFLWAITMGKSYEV